MHYRHSGRRRNYQRAMLAFDWTSDDEGLTCLDADEAIATSARCGVAAARQDIRDIESDGIIRVYRPSDYRVPSRLIVLMDHPDAPRIAAGIRVRPGRTGIRVVGGGF